MQLTLKTPTAEDVASRSLLSRVHNIVEALRAQSTHYQELVVVKEGEPAESRMFALLIEDRTSNTVSLAEFNAQLNKAIAQSS